MSAPTVVRRLVILTALLGLALLGGCATSSPPALYVLDSGPVPAAEHAPQPGAPTLMVAPVATAAYLNQSGIVYQTEPHQIVIANNNRWASPLTKQLTDSLYATLEKRLSNVNIVRVNATQKGLYVLYTRVDQFTGRYDGKAIVSGRWKLVGPQDKTLASHAFIKDVALQADGYPALVSSLASGWQRVARAMIPALDQALHSQSGA